MKPIIKKILEAGLVSKHTALLMEKWRSLSPGSAELVGAKEVSEASLVQFAEELEELIESDREIMRETKLAISIGEPMLITWVILQEEARPSALTKMAQDLGTKIVVFRDEMQNFIFPLKEGAHMEVNNRFQVTDGAVWRILESVPLHVGDQLYAYQVRADCVLMPNSET